MLKRIVIIGALLSIPIAFWIASQYGTVEEVSFSQALEMSEEAVSEEQSKKVVIQTTISELPFDNSRMKGRDNKGSEFAIEYTGSEPDSPFQVEMKVRFVGHVHGGPNPYFHATQAFIP